MYLRWLGLTLLILSLIIGTVIATNVKILHRTEVFAQTEDDMLLEDKVVSVPPWNGTEGWVGFNVTLSHKGKMNYEAYGLILPNDEDPEPKTVMRVVNETGLAILRFDQFSTEAWNYTKVYAAAYLDRNRLYDSFRFLEVDNSSKYVFLFRGLKNETEPRPILISLKEAWYEGKILLEPTAPNILIVAATTILGLSLTIRSSLKTRGRRLRRSRMHK